MQPAPRTGRKKCQPAASALRAVMTTSSRHRSSRSVNRGKRPRAAAETVEGAKGGVLLVFHPPPRAPRLQLRQGQGRQLAAVGLPQWLRGGSVSLFERTDPVRNRPGGGHQRISSSGTGTSGIGGSIVSRRGKDGQRDSVSWQGRSIVAHACRSLPVIRPSCCVAVWRTC